MRATGVVTVSGEDFNVVGSSVGLISRATGTDDNGSAIEWTLEVGPSVLGNAWVGKQVTRVDVLLTKAAAATANLSICNSEDGVYGTAKVLSAGSILSTTRVPVPVVSADYQEVGSAFKLKIIGSGRVVIHDVLFTTYQSGR